MNEDIELAIRLIQSTGLKVISLDKTNNQLLVQIPNSRPLSGKIMDEIGNLLITKQLDYGPGNINNAFGGPINGLLGVLAISLNVLRIFIAALRRLSTSLLRIHLRTWLTMLSLHSWLSEGSGPRSD
jgi:hypothetical protein